ncbi:hypothetical protein [Hymenobacter rubripertinctus]|uniref:Uncharacterized protein n=1 Tax=Hymenobacter rubripertinctus TaxID=2029981 RepID=A0A418R6J2_9BACT|nr:hypothetical protein [Hymenobacter rubripertinctus]RIY13012.1 hypothetical protein D0T11_04600 [Hymenobacter rubripertinctus]
MKKTFEDESDALSTSPTKPTTAQEAAITPPHEENKEAPAPDKSKSPTAEGTPVPTEGNGTPDYSGVAVKTEPELPTPDKAGGSATAPESGGGYSG